MLDGETAPVRVINLSVTPSNYIYSLNLLDALSKLITNYVREKFYTHCIYTVVM